MSVDAEIRAIIEEAAEEYEQPERSLADSHGVAALPTLLATLEQWKLARAAYGELARYPLEVRRKEIHPKVLQLAVRMFCEGFDPSNCGFEAERLVEFLIAELEHAPELPTEFAQAVGKRPIKERCHHFFAFAKASRDPALIPLLSGMHDEFNWGFALLALEARELAKEVLVALQERAAYNDWELGLAAGLFAGAAARESLMSLYEGEGYRKDSYALGLAFLGDAADAELFKKLSTKDHGATAKRIYTIKTKTKAKDRVAVLDKMKKDADLPSVLLFVQLLEDDDRDVALYAAELLATYMRERGKHAEPAYQLPFLRAVDRLQEAGRIDALLYEQLEAARATIPRTTPLAPPSAAATPVAARQASGKKATANKATANKATTKAGAADEPPRPRRPRHIIRW